MALGRGGRMDSRRSSSYCSTSVVVGFVALCLVGVWMMTSSSVVPVQNVDISQDDKAEVKQTITETDSRQFEDSPGDLPEDAVKGDSNSNASQDETNSDVQDNQKVTQQTTEETTSQETQEQKPEKESEAKVTDQDETSKPETNTGEPKAEDGGSNSDSGETKNEGGDTKNEGGETQSEVVEAKSEGGETKSEGGETKSEGGETKSEAGETKSEGGETKTGGGETKMEGGETKSESGETNVGEQAEPLDRPVETRKDDKMEAHVQEKVDENQYKQSESSSSNKKDSTRTTEVQNEVFPDGTQSELLNETSTQKGAGSWSTQAVESKNEKEAQRSSMSKDDTSASGFKWKVCNVTAGSDYIPCLDNVQALKHLKTTKHYEHRERHCPEEPPTCLVSLPAGYRRSIEWPKSRDKIWYYNVPHTKLAEVKGHQNWVKVTGEFLTFPGGGTQFKYGAPHYIDFIQEGVPDIEWGKRSRVILDVGCGVASFGGYLFDRDVLTMSFAPKDEHEAQVQFALERGIPALSAVMGTKRLPFPSNVFDAVHCARCRVPWHIEGGKLLLELNRLLRPGGYFVWSATPVYQKEPEDVEIWDAMSILTKKMCWELVTIKEDKVDFAGAAIYRKPLTNECYEKRPENDPPLCKETDDPNAAWNVPLQACMHKVQVDESERGSKWPEQWPARLEKAPYWLKSTQVGVYGKPAPEDFTVDYDHWKRVVKNSYMNGMGISWSNVRNVMDMRSVYGGLAAALKDLNLWVMNIVSIDSPDTLPIIYERGLFGMYHDWCESHSTYPRSYDLLHADHLFSKLKKRCNFVAVIAEVDRILRPEGKLIVRDKVEIINEVEKMARSLQWEIRLSYTKDKEGLLCVQKTMWRPEEVETIPSAIA